MCDCPWCREQAFHLEPYYLSPQAEQYSHLYKRYLDLSWCVLKLKYPDQDSLKDGHELPFE